MKFIRTTLAAVALAGLAPSAFAQQPTQPPAAAATSTTQASSAAVPPAPAHALAADLRVSAQVMGPDGQPAATIETADATGAVVSTGTARGRLALDAFTKNESGLMIGYTRADLNRMGTPITPAATAPAAAAPAAAAPGSSPAPANQQPSADAQAPRN